VTRPAGTPIHAQFRITEWPSIRYAESDRRNDDALPLRSCDSDRQWVVTGFAAACGAGGAAAGASTGRDVT
jgi:hypothetical protein